jgi:hypothetical protein
MAGTVIFKAPYKSFIGQTISWHELSVLPPGTNRIICETHSFVYIRFEVLVNGHSVRKESYTTVSFSMNNYKFHNSSLNRQSVRDL